MNASPKSLELATREKIDRVLEAHSYDPTQIVGILLDVQDLFERHYVPEPAAYYVAEKLPLKISLIYDCLTFYASLSPTPRASSASKSAKSPTTDASRSKRRRASALVTSRPPCASTAKSTGILTAARRSRNFCTRCSKRPAHLHRTCAARALHLLQPRLLSARRTKRTGNKTTSTRKETI